MNNSHIGKVVFLFSSFFLIFLVVFSGTVNAQCEEKIIASDGMIGDYFGHAVSVSNQRVVIGARGDDEGSVDQGSVYVYERSGLILDETKLLASDGDKKDYFGHSVAIDGDRIVVGAYRDDDKGTDAGAAYVFEWDGTNWVETKLLASDGAATDYFGFAVDISGDRIIVGSFADDDNDSDSGSAYIFEWDGTSWIETKLLASDGESSDNFGIDVAIQSDRVIVGASRDDDNGTESGSAYIFAWDGSNWNEYKLLATDGTAEDNYGFRVDIYGTRAVVAADKDDVLGFNSGSVYVYNWDGSSWIQHKIVPNDGAAEDNFGSDVAIDGYRILIGSAGDDDKGLNSGSIYIFLAADPDYLEVKLSAPDGAPSDFYGMAVDVNGQETVVGVHLDDDNGINSGSAYINLNFTNVFIDSGSGMWDDASNWSLGVVPDICHNVIIPAGQSATLLNGEMGACFTVTVEETGILCINIGAIFDAVAPGP